MQYATRRGTNATRLRAISLFTGAGGLDLGFEAAGFETVVAVEFDPDAIKTIRHTRDWPLIPEDIHSEAATSEKILSLGRIREGDADVLIGGPPCQPFSKSGYWARGDALRLADPRASTLGAYLRVLRDSLPKTFLLENVPGIAFSAKDEGLAFLRREIERINTETSCNYSFQAAVLRATEYGVPQDRQRVFVVGHRDGRDFRFPSPTHLAAVRDLPSGQLSLAAESLQSFHSAWDAIGDLEDDDHPSLRVTGKWANLLPTIPEGKNYLHHTNRGNGLEIFGWRRRYWSFLLKLAKGMPSWTIAAQPGPAIGPFHWKNRRLSAKELCRLQTFPEGYQVLGTLRAVQKQIGNAVPSALAEVLALEIRGQLLNDKESSNCRPTLLPKRRGQPPPEEPLKPVPAEYLSLVGCHEAHPGTGKGYGAALRAAAATDKQER
jgi:DNA (cytosine-5)-methyltransferase 1